MPRPHREGRLSAAGTFVRRNFEPLVLSVQVLVDLAVIWLACWLGWTLRESLAGERGPDFAHYREVFLLTAAVTLVSFHATGMYSPLKSLLNIEEFKSVAKSTLTSFLIVHALLLLLRTATGLPEHGIYRLLIPLHNFVNIEITDERGVWQFSRMGVLLAFVMIGLLTTTSRFCSFKVIQWLHRHGIGNRNVLIFGTGDTARRLQKKFVLVPTLGLNLLGFVSARRDEVGSRIDRFEVLGVAEELEFLIRRHKISEVFVAIPEADERELMSLIETLEREDVVYHIVPRFHHIFSHRVRIETLDSIPLVTRPDRKPSFLQSTAKRTLDLFVALTALAFAAPLFIATAILIRRESPGPVFFRQKRVGKDGAQFEMLKFRTMHVEQGGDAPKPKSPHDPRLTAIGRWLRRYSLDELPQLINVLTGEMSIVGPRPEMAFIVERYGPLERERLRVKPGLTGLWQISYARGEAIHENMEYDIYYIEHQSFLLDVVIIALTGFAVVKGTGAY
ncbi:MAG: sugar transferase [Planctomycetes bacterium]|nr:sugar transferase [Planctomycetota bacterium]